MTLTAALPKTADPDTLYDAFAGWASERGLDLYPHQEEALIEIVSGANVILATPTGSGKSLVAIAAHFAALADDRTQLLHRADQGAGVGEVLRPLRGLRRGERRHAHRRRQRQRRRPDHLLHRGDPGQHRAARGRRADVGQVVMDEFHFYAEPDRGWAWQVPLLELPQAQFVLMSATLGDVTRFVDDLTRRTGRPTAVVRSAERPVPLHFSYATTPLHETLEELLATKQAPVYVVHFTQAAALERAQALMSVNVCTRAEKDAIAEAIGDFRFTSGFGRTLSRLVRHGIGVHHAGMLPEYRRLVETLAQAGLLKVICGTDTLGVGINVPIRTVLFTGLTKYDGIRTRLLNAREFHQIAGRAGRAGFDTIGRVVVQAPEHVIENEKALAKAGDDPKKRRKVVRKKPPEGFIGWGEPTFERLVEAEPEPLTSSFQVSHAMLLDVIDRPGDAFAAMRHLLTDNHEDAGRPAPAHPPGHRHLPGAARRRRGRGAARAGRDRPAGPAHRRPPARLRAQPAAVAVRAGRPRAARPRSPRRTPLDVVSVIESILDDPRQILSAQQFKARGEAVAAMKADGIEYEERMELLEEVTYPKPLAELLDRRVRDVPAGPPVGRRPRARPQVRGPGHVRAGDDLRRVRAVLRADPVRGPGAALPRRRLQGAAADRPGGRQDRGPGRPHRVARRAGPPGRLQPARRVGAAAQPVRRGRGGRRRWTTGRRRSPATRGRSGCWCATRCSAGSSWPRCAAGTCSASWTPATAGTPTRWADALEPYFDEYDDRGRARTRAGRRC